MSSLQHQIELCNTWQVSGNTIMTEVLEWGAIDDASTFIASGVGLGLEVATNGVGILQSGSFKSGIKFTSGLPSKCGEVFFQIVENIHGILHGFAVELIHRMRQHAYRGHTAGSLQ